MQHISVCLCCAASQTMAQRRERLSHSVCHRVNAASWAVLSGPSGGIIAGNSPQSTRAVASLTKLTNALATVQWARQAEPRLGYNPLHELVTVSTHVCSSTTLSCSSSSSPPNSLPCTPSHHVAGRPCHWYSCALEQRRDVQTQRPTPSNAAGIWK